MAGASLPLRQTRSRPARPPGHVLRGHVLRARQAPGVRVAGPRWGALRGGVADPIMEVLCFTGDRRMYIFRSNALSGFHSHIVLGDARPPRLRLSTMLSSLTWDFRKVSALYALPIEHTVRTVLCLQSVSDSEYASEVSDVFTEDYNIIMSL